MRYTCTLTHAGVGACPGHYSTIIIIFVILNQLCVIISLATTSCLMICNMLSLLYSKLLHCSEDNNFSIRPWKIMLKLFPTYFPIIYPFFQCIKLPNFNGIVIPLQKMESFVKLWKTQGLTSRCAPVIL